MKSLSEDLNVSNKETSLVIERSLTTSVHPPAGSFDGLSPIRDLNQSNLVHSSSALTSTPRSQVLFEPIKTLPQSTTSAQANELTQQAPFMQFMQQQMQLMQLMMSSQPQMQLNHSSGFVGI